MDSRHCSPNDGLALDEFHSSSGTWMAPVGSAFLLMSSRVRTEYILARRWVCCFKEFGKKCLDSKLCLPNDEAWSRIEPYLP